VIEDETQPTWEDVKAQMENDYEMENDFEIDMADNEKFEKTKLRKEQDKQAQKLGIPQIGEQLFCAAIENAEWYYSLQNDPYRCHVCDPNLDFQKVEAECECKAEEEEEGDEAKNTTICLECNDIACTCTCTYWAELPIPIFNTPKNVGPDPDSGSETESDDERPLTDEESAALEEKRQRDRALQSKRYDLSQKHFAKKRQVLELQGTRPDTDEVPNPVLDSLGYVTLTSGPVKVCIQCMHAHGLKPKKPPKKTTQSSPKVPKAPDRIRNDIYCLLIQNDGSTPVKFNSLTQLAKHVGPDTSSVKVQEQTEKDFSDHEYAKFEFVHGDTKVLFYWTNVPADASEAQEKKANKIKVKLTNLFTKTPVQN